MKKTYLFKKNQWERDDFFYIYALPCKAFKEFIEEENCLSNSYNEEIQDYDYISMVTKKKFKKGVKLSTKCSFDSFGAPLIVITDDVLTNSAGKPQFGLHFEAVGYEDGCNIWKVIPYPPRVECPRKSTLISDLKFKVEDRSVIDLSVIVGDKELFVEMNGQKLSVKHEEIPEEFHVGITACEGVNHFFEFTVDDGE